MYKTHMSSTDSFLLFEIVDDDMTRIDSVVITKYYPHNVLDFYHSIGEYVEEYSSIMSRLIDDYEGKVDFDNAIETRSIAEFELWKTVNGWE